MAYLKVEWRDWGITDSWLVFTVISLDVHIQTLVTRTFLARLCKPEWGRQLEVQISGEKLVMNLVLLNESIHWLLYAIIYNNMHSFSNVSTLSINVLSKLIDK